MAEQDVQSIISGRLDRRIQAISPLHGGKNNRLYKVELADGSALVAKFYFNHPSDQRNRLDADFRAHAFLWDAGVRAIARPHLRCDEDSFALYDFIDGSRPMEFAASDIDQVISFVACLKELTRQETARALPVASEASFSAHDLCRSIEQRLGRLISHATPDTALQQDFKDFVHEQLRSALQNHSAGLGQQPNPAFFAIPLPAEFRILSPSDFGFHNAIRDKHGYWFFHDFEYFGWDDPAKLICDFVLHPGMQLPVETRSYFTKKCLQVFYNHPGLARRFELLLPLYAIKWCIIILNEFIPEFRVRRGYAARICEHDLNAALSGQFNKAVTLFNTYCHKNAAAKLLCV